MGGKDGSVNFSGSETEYELTHKKDPVDEMMETSIYTSSIR